MGQRSRTVVCWDQTTVCDQQAKQKSYGLKWVCKSECWQWFGMMTNMMNCCNNHCTFVYCSTKAEVNLQNWEEGNWKEMCISELQNCIVVWGWARPHLWKCFLLPLKVPKPHPPWALATLILLNAKGLSPPCYWSSCSVLENWTWHWLCAKFSGVLRSNPCPVNEVPGQLCHPGQSSSLLSPLTSMDFKGSSSP